MKALFVALVALLFAFFLACQSSITDPVVTDSQLTAVQEESAYKDAASLFPGVIRLSESLSDPVHTLFDVQISGVVKYNLEQININDPSLLKVSIYVNADLKHRCPGQNRHWWVYGLTQDVLPISHTAILEKSYTVRNTCGCHYNLIIRYKVNEKEVLVMTMELKSVGGCYADKNFF